MRFISIKDLIYIIPDLLELFLSGFVFMTFFTWLNNKKIELSTVILWSLFISFIIKSFWSTIHLFILNNMAFTSGAKTLVYLFTGIFMSLICTYSKNKSELLRILLYFSSNKSVNDDIFDEIIDYEEPTMLQIYIKASNIFYIGKFCVREEKGLDSWIVIVNYFSVDRTNNEVVYNPDDGNLKSVAMISLKDIERIEVIYENDSRVWKKLTGNSLDNEEDTEDIHKDN